MSEAGLFGAYVRYPIEKGSSETRLRASSVERCSADKLTRCWSFVLMDRGCWHLSCGVAGAFLGCQETATPQGDDLCLQVFRRFIL